MKKIIIALVIAIGSLSATAQEAEQFKSVDQFFDYYSEKECAFYSIVNSTTIIKQGLRKPIDFEISSLKVFSLWKCFDRAEAWETVSKIIENNHAPLEQIDENTYLSYNKCIKDSPEDPKNEMFIYLKTESILTIVKGDFTYENAREYVINQFSK